MSSQDEAVQMIDDCENRSEKMTDWECQFIDSLSHQIASRALSQKQIETLSRIWERVT